MKIGILKMPLAATALLLVLSGTAQAQDTYDVHCDTLDGLYDATAELEFTTDKDRTGLQGKVTEAQAKLAEGKDCDATQKLRDYQSKLDKLLGAAKPKVSEEPHPGTLACIFLALDTFIDDNCAGDPPRGKGPKKK
jgi:hypothetical protein